METFDVIVIGGGAAGIMAAIKASQKGGKVLLLEKNKVLGRKILATGNGRCNLTNRDITMDRYHGASPSFIEGVLKKFEQDETISYFESLGVILKEEARGRIFPRSNQASTIVEALNHALAANNVLVITEATVKSIESKGGFVASCENGSTYTAKKLILATGGKAAFPLGSSGDGLFWAKKLGHTIVPIYAALVPLETKEEWVRNVQGIKVEAKVTTKVGNRMIKETEGDVLFTHFGLSGPAIMAQAGEISPLVEKGEVQIFLDLYPDIKNEELDTRIEGIFRANPKRDIKNALAGLLPANLVPTLLEIAGISPDKNAAEASKVERKSIVRLIKDLPLTIKKVRPLKEAQVSRGGVDAREINPDTLESNIIPGVYFCGEVIDVDGDSGGFNLQWAWSSGHMAGENSSVII